MLINNFNSSSYFISYIYGITQNAETLEYRIVMEFARHGDMRKYLSTNFHSKSWLSKLKIAGSIADGLRHIHSFCMVHRDLRSGNILQFNPRRVYIGGLGLCQPIKNEAKTTTGKDTKEENLYGVIPYIPPEVLIGENFTLAGDIYSYGMLLWELATGKPPFYDRDHDQILIMTILDEANLRLPSHLFHLDPNPKNRPTVEEVANKLWKLYNMYSLFRYKNSTDEEFIDEEFSYEEPKTVSLQFLESDKYVREMAESDDSTTTNQSTTTTTTRILQGAVYTSRVLTLQMIDFSKDES
ncbi:hypothetical protein G9A89_008437 [Geosiphon pyriformis]|nr:hypothetical protein G9A89_008437 [Geosiphon pyriformis]